MIKPPAFLDYVRPLTAATAVVYSHGVRPGANGGMRR